MDNQGMVGDRGDDDDDIDDDESSEGNVMDDWSGE
jgi:hypothetical protein